MWRGVALSGVAWREVVRCDVALNGVVWCGVAWRDVQAFLGEIGKNVFDVHLGKGVGTQGSKKLGR